MMLWNDVLEEIREIETPTQAVAEMIFACRNRLAYPLEAGALIEFILEDQLLQDTDTAIAFVDELVPGARLGLRKVAVNRWSVSVSRDDLGIEGHAFAAHPALGLVKAGIEARVDSDLLEETTTHPPDRPGK